MPTDETAPGDTHPQSGGRAPAEGRERRQVRRLQVLLVLALAGAGVLAVLWRDAAAESRRLGELRLDAEVARAEAERQREVADLAAARLAEERSRALAAQVDAERARSELAVAEYARAVQLAHQEWGADIRRAREVLGDTGPEPRSWEWRYLFRSPATAPPPRAKE